jgi:hypothetical protein
MTRSLFHDLKRTIFYDVQLGSSTKLMATFQDEVVD